MIDIPQFRIEVIAPAIKRLGLPRTAAQNLAAEELLLGTALAESELRYLTQLEGGPARGLWQIEPFTHHDLWLSWGAYNAAMMKPVLDVIPDAAHPHSLKQELGEGWRPDHDLLVWHLLYAAMIARLLYWRVPEALPAQGDVEGQAAYWKRRYNTPAGAGELERFVGLWRAYVEKPRA